jgi:glycerol kinase
MEKDSGTALATLAVDGGMAKSDLCMQVCQESFVFLNRSGANFLQIQADLTGICVERPQMLETTALGAAIAAGFGAGIWTTFAELATVNETGLTTFVPRLDLQARDGQFARWEKAVSMCRGWSS